MYLSDLYLDAEARGRGIGRRLMAEVARLTRTADCVSVALGVRKDDPVRLFCEHLGMTVHDDAVGCRLGGDTLTQLAQEAS